MLYIGCVELLLDTIHPFLLGSSSLLTYALKIVEVLGSYRYGEYYYCRCAKIMAF